MIRVCAWCEAEGRPAVLASEDGVPPVGLRTHGICPEHKEGLWEQVRLRREAIERAAASAQEV